MDPGSLQRYVRKRIGFFVCGFLTLGILLLAVFKDKGWLDVRARAKQLKGIESQICNIEAENQRLIEEIQALRTDPVRNREDCARTAQARQTRRGRDHPAGREVAGPEMKDHGSAVVGVILIFEDAGLLPVR